MHDTSTLYVRSPFSRIKGDDRIYSAKQALLASGDALIKVGSWVIAANNSTQSCVNYFKADNTPREIDSVLGVALCPNGVDFDPEDISTYVQGDFTYNVSDEIPYVPFDSCISVPIDAGIGIGSYLMPDPNAVTNVWGKWIKATAGKPAGLRVLEIRAVDQTIHPNSVQVMAYCRVIAPYVIPTNPSPAPEPDVSSAPEADAGLKAKAVK